MTKEPQPRAPEPRTRRHRRVTRLAAVTATVTATAATLLVAGAGAALAHVSVNPGTAAAGAESTLLTFRVPTESETAGTVGITVTLPADHPFAYLSVQPVPGWTVTPSKTTLPAPVTEGNLTIKEAVTSVTWTAATGTRIGPGEFQDFSISAGPVPQAESLMFPTTQTYDDGSVVAWNEPTPASGGEPEHPVPTLTITAAAAGSEAGGGHHSEGTSAAAEASGAASADPVASGVSAAPEVTATTTPVAAATSTSTTTPTVLAVIGIVLAAAALLVAVMALRRRPGAPRA